MVAAFLLPALARADAIGLNKLADIAFGTIDFEGATGSGNVSIGSNGNVTYGNNTSGTGLGTAGQIEITGTVGTTVTISCSSSGELALPGHGNLQITPVHFNIGSGNVGSYATGTECSGIGTSVATHTIDGTSANNTIFIGGLLNVDGHPLSNGTFRGSTGGTTPNFQILVQ